MKQGEERKVGHYSWLYGVIAGGCVAAMQIGVGLLQVEGEFAIIMGAAQGLLVCSLTVICGSMMEWLLTPLPIEDEDKPLHPGRERIREYGTAFRSLADSFLSPSALEINPTEEGRQYWTCPPKWICYGIPDLTKTGRRWQCSLMKWHRL